MAANTLIKYGMVYDPKQTDDCIRFYENGVQLTTEMSNSTLTGKTNLDANALGVIASVIADSAADAVKFYLSRWRCFQLGHGAN